MHDSDDDQIKGKCREWIKIFKKNQKITKVPIEIIFSRKIAHSGHFSKPLILWLEIIRKSPHSREITLYCPYLIYNDTELSMIFSELKDKS